MNWLERIVRDTYIYIVGEGWDEVVVVASVASQRAIDKYYDNQPKL